MVAVLLTACTSIAPPLPSNPQKPSDRPAQAASPGATASAPPGLASCAAPNANAAVARALSAIRGYSYAASGFAYVQDYTSDPDSPPKTRRVRTRFEARYVAPDRYHTKQTEGASGTEPDESVAIGQDLFVRTPDGWEALRGGANPADANELAALLADFGPGWGQARRVAGDPPGDGCLYRIRVPVSRGAGYRELTVLANLSSALPTGIRIVVRDAIDPFGNRHDSDVLYRVAYGGVKPIEPPPVASPSP